jgi:uncharacterized protein YacL (UPF0231 family)
LRSIKGVSKHVISPKQKVSRQAKETCKAKSMSQNLGLTLFLITKEIHVIAHKISMSSEEFLEQWFSIYMKLSSEQYTRDLIVLMPATCLINISGPFFKVQTFYTIL